MTQTASIAYQRARAQVNTFNAEVPPGTPVLAFPRTLDDPPVRTRTRGEAWVMPSGSPVVRVDDVTGKGGLSSLSGGIHLDHIKTICPTCGTPAEAT